MDKDPKNMRLDELQKEIDKTIKGKDGAEGKGSLLGDLRIGHENKAAAQRARAATKKLDKLFLAYRKASPK